jgi:N,N'-diacetyllegionaminate synthase
MVAARAHSARLTGCRRVEIAGRNIGGDARPFVIAEAGVNHNGDPDLALSLVDAAAVAGADAIKFQTFAAGSLVAPETPQAEYQRERASAAGQLEMLRALELPSKALRACRDRADARGIVFLSTPFDSSAVELLVSLGVPAFKVASGDLTNLLLLREIAAHGRPMLLSTGMATLAEVDTAVAAVGQMVPLALLQCTSAYPAASADSNLRAIVTMRQRFGVPVGYSDHTIGITTAIAATALGASLIEKHLTLDRGMRGPDHHVSLEPGEFGALVRAVAEAHAALGDGVKQPTDREEEARILGRRSLVARRHLEAGHTIVVSDLDSRRPATGVSPSRADEVVGRKTTRALDEGAFIRADDLHPALPSDAA